MTYGPSAPVLPAASFSVSNVTDLASLKSGPAAVRGLSEAEVAALVASGRTNAASTSSSRSFVSIVRANVLTRFNALLGGMLVVILVIGPLQDALFGVVLLVNTAIGVAQELRARVTLDRLALLHAPHARVIRDATVREIAEQSVVLGDLIELSRGDQIVVDGELLAAEGLEVDESLLTGEPDSVPKEAGGRLMSGTAVVAGSALMRATAVGSEAFAQGLAAEAKRFSLVSSELQSSNNTILRLVTWAIFPVAALLLWSQLSGTMGVREALRGSVAGVANMIPEGLVLLTSIAYAVGALRLAKNRVLVRELAAVEGLARVDVLCIDKTGTITTGDLVAVELRVLDPNVDAARVMASLAANETTASPSLVSLAALHEAAPLPCVASVPFSSERRWSGATLEGLGSFVVGAPEALLPPGRREALQREIESELRAGHRVLLLASVARGLAGEQLPDEREPIALGILAETVRPDAAETLSFLRDQGVAVKVISGDNPVTVAAVAAAAGIDTRQPVDATRLPESDTELAALAETSTIFGRVGPREKRRIVTTLQAAGHVVAMTGDGVNDVLALRDADLGIAMGSGSPACRAAARVVLLDSAFAILPKLLAEGRRVLANVERVSKLFVTKTVYAALLATAIGIARVPYPFYPRNFTLISTVTIGVPAFFLALPPAATRLRAGYLKRVRTFVLPAGVVLGGATLAAYLVDRIESGGTEHARTTATLVLGTAGLWVLARIARPFAWWKVLLVGGLAGLFGLALALPVSRHFLALRFDGGRILVVAAVAVTAAITLLEIAWKIQAKRAEGRASAE